MSRWINSFKNHNFQKPWKEIVEVAQNLTIPNETIITDIEELARLKKVVSYIDALLKAADPELISNNIWNSFYKEAGACIEQIRKFNNNDKNIIHLNHANNHLDSLLSYIRPYIVSDVSAAQAAVTAFKNYSNTVSQQFGILKSNTKNAVAHITKNKEESDKLYSKIEKSQQKIQQLENTFLNGNEKEKSLQEKITEWSTEISDFHKKLTTGNEQEAALILQIEKAKNKSVKNSEIIVAALNSSEDLIENLETFHTRIFGEKDDAGNTRGGLKQELENRQKEFDIFKKDQKKAYETLFKKIESLIPGATSAGLASAYCERKKSYDNSIKGYSILFYMALFGILCAGIWFIKFADINDPITIFNNILYKIPIFGSLICLAMFASKRRSEDRRLQQEYAHKEALTKSYQSFKKQIKDLKDEDKELMKKLLDTTIEAIAFNASTTLDGKHGDKIPMQELGEKIVDAIPDIVKDKL